MSTTPCLGLKKPGYGNNVVEGYVGGQPAEADNLDRIDAAILALQQGGGGGGSDAHFIFSQNVASSVWNVQHNLGKYPSVTAVDSSGHQVIGDVAHNSPYDLTLVFSAPFAGNAYLN